MRLILLLFDILLLSVALVRFEDIHPNVYSGFQHIDAKNIAEKLVTCHKDTSCTSFLRCEYFYCHGVFEDLRFKFNVMAPVEIMRFGVCSTHCQYLREHTITIMESWLPKLNSTVPDKDVQECAKKCKLDCTAPYGGCSTDCYGVCKNHYKFSNRLEYETEFLELMMRLNRFYN